MARPVRGALPWLWLSAVLIVVDQITKWVALEKLEYLRPVTFIEGFWDWTLVYNYGAAFSFLSDAGGWQRWFFTALAVLISGGLVWWLARTPRDDWRTALPFALVFAGAVGNLIDRLRFGYVVDFIDWYIAGSGLPHWPAFNVADACIVAGAVLLVAFSFRAAPKPSAGG